MSNKIDVSLIKEYFSINNNGVISWKKKASSCTYKDHVCGTIGRRGYISIQFRYKIYQAHRIAWVLYYGSWPKGNIDHIDHNKTNNTKENLRIANNIENGRNQTLFSTNTSGFTGVVWNKLSNKWVAKITVDGNRVHLGYFFNKKDAVEARCKANVKYGFHENHGRKQEDIYEVKE